MKAWLCLLNDGAKRADGWMGTVYATEEDARAIHGRVVEVEIPDPPHEWRIGDWFHLGGAIRRRIADIVPSDGVAVTHWRDAYGTAHCKQEWMSVIKRDATPCDPPEWWEGDR